MRSLRLPLVAAAALAVWLSLCWLSPVSGQSSSSPTFFTAVLNSTSTPPTPWTPRVGGVLWTDGEGNTFLVGGASTAQPSLIPTPDTTNNLDDVWESSDAGLTWSALPSLSTSGSSDGTYGHSAVLYQGQHWVFGAAVGQCWQQTSSIWTLPAAQGVASSSWTAVQAPWNPRAVAMATVWTPPASTGQAQQIIYAGGLACQVQGGGSIGPYPMNDVWSYDTSGQWTQLTDSAPWLPTAGAGFTTVQGGSLIIMAGGGVAFSVMDFVRASAVWMGAWDASSLALTWTQLTDAAPFSSRYALMTSGDDDYLYLIQGLDAYGSGDFGNDVRARHSHACALTEDAVILTVCVCVCVCVACMRCCPLGVAEVHHLTLRLLITFEQLLLLSSPSRPSHRPLPLFPPCAQLQRRLHVGQHQLGGLLLRSQRRRPGGSRQSGGAGGRLRRQRGQRRRVSGAAAAGHVRRAANGHSGALHSRHQHRDPQPRP